MPRLLSGWRESRRIRTGEIIVHRGAYEFLPSGIRDSDDFDDFLPQTAPPTETLPPPALNPGAVSPLNPLGST